MPFDSGLYLAVLNARFGVNMSKSRSSFFIVSLLAGITFLSTSASCFSQSGPFLPKFGFAEYGEQIGSAPAMASYHNKLYIAFQADDPSHTLWIDSTSDGIIMDGARAFPSVEIDSSPALTVLNGILYLASATREITPGSTYPVFPNGQTGTQICQTTDVQNFACTAVAHLTNGTAPALAVLNNRLILASLETITIGNSTTNNQLSYCQFGITYLNGVCNAVPGEFAGAPPALAVLNQQLVWSFQSNDSGHQDWLQASSESSTNSLDPGLSFNQAFEYGEKIGGAPALVAYESGYGFGQTGVLAFQADDPNHHLWYATVVDANLNPYFKIRQDDATIGSSPAEAIFTPTVGPYAGQEAFYVAFQSNDPGHHLWFGGQPTSTFSSTN